MARARRHSHLPPRHYLPAPLTAENRDLLRRGSWNKWEYPPNFNDLILLFRTHKQLLPSGLVLFFTTPEGISAYYMIKKKKIRIKFLLFPQPPLPALNIEFCKTNLCYYSYRERILAWMKKNFKEDKHKRCFVSFKAV